MQKQALTFILEMLGNFRWPYGLTVESQAVGNLFSNYGLIPLWVEGLTVKEGVDVYVVSSSQGRAPMCFSLPSLTSSVSRPSRLFVDLIHPQLAPADDPGM